MISTQGKIDNCQSLKYLIIARVQEILEVVNVVNNNDNNDNVIDSNTIENFHELRKQVRSLRALLIFIKPLDRKHLLNEDRKKLRDWFMAGNIRRDLDSLNCYWKKLQERQSSFLSDISLLSKYLHDRSLLTIAIAPSNQLVTPLLNIKAVMEQGNKWCAEKKSLKNFVKKRLRNWDRTIKNKGYSFEVMDKKELHILRIRCKNLRYTAEAFLPLWPEKDNVLIVKALKNIQELLGQIHDIDNTPVVISEVLNDKNPHIAFEVGFLRGWQAASRIDHIRLLKKKWGRYRKAKPTWRNAN
ncbi:MAG: CHAD domain-containing protein [Candidatus Acididesulfobacter diazotrophicus]|jgi:CHAD domain-containing protein|uniref:CHAD domain-containing protein n=1 Tax=Candidatus Acididesulfobacter diazotrophicus TaxID=2597226 RepID=A0A519BJX6_9DELT|nr:MAG: CHAD domain-containing protein [Candidatus Acididesulfobacter diazotrophicus]